MDEDRQMKIWSRVKGAPGGAVSNLQPMIAGAMGQAAVFGALMRQMPVGAQGQLRMLREAELTHARCLRGIGMLSGCGQLKVAVAPVKQERPETVLRRSYGNALRAMRDYGDRSGDPEYGPVFQWMERREAEHCAILAQLMGMIAL